MIQRSLLNSSFYSLLCAAMLSILASGNVCAEVSADHHNKVPASVDDLSWMTGSWAGPAGPNVLEENWAEPKNNSMVAVVRMMGEGNTSMVELIAIEPHEESLTLRVQQWNPGFSPRTPGPQVMKLEAITKNSVTFTATGEGGLASLSYSRPQSDKFVISIETSGGDKFDLTLTAQ
jgi:hypothetical protein